MRILLLCSLLITSRAFAAEPSLLEHLTVFLSGSFSNADQARGDVNFKSAVLHIAPIWADRTDGPWLYGEQALADAPAHPYRQFVYQLAATSENTLEIRLFDLPDLIAATGAWKDPARIASLTPERLRPRPGCTIVLRLQPNGIFKGATEGRGCTDGSDDTAYSTIEAAISSQSVMLWERGFNAAGAQIRGSIHGGYTFKKAD
jgi:CpeT protein